MKTTAFPGFPADGLKFLRGLKRNNNLDWFQARKEIYEKTVKEPMEALVEAMAAEFERFAPEMIAVPAKCMYRIHRDTRFSTDKTPYKTHVAAVFPAQGLGKHQGAGFYVHVSPDEVLIGGGLYLPMPGDLSATRARLAQQHRKFRTIVESPRFVEGCGELSGEQLKKTPRGYAEDHPAADLLRRKQFLAGKTLPPGVALTPDLHGLMVEAYRAMTPMVRFLNQPLLAASASRSREQAILSD